MCGRTTNTIDRDQLAGLLDVAEVDAPELPASWNVAPTRRSTSWAPARRVAEAEGTEMGVGALLGQGAEVRFHQRPCRDRGREARVPCSGPLKEGHRPYLRVLRVAPG